jgi:hypothetical protein
MFLFTVMIQSGTGMRRYRTEISDAGMPMPAALDSMPMPGYGGQIIRYSFCDLVHIFSMLRATVLRLRQAYFMLILFTVVFKILSDIVTLCAVTL